MNVGVFLLAMLPALALLLTVWVSDPDKGPRLLFGLRLAAILLRSEVTFGYNRGRMAWLAVRIGMGVPPHARPFTAEIVRTLSSSYRRSTTASVTSGTTT